MEMFLLECCLSTMVDVLEWLLWLVDRIGTVVLFAVFVAFAVAQFAFPVL